MRFAADENINRSLVDALEGAGHEVFWVRRDQPGIPDIRILQLAQQESRIVLTADRDFGELAFAWKLPAACGIILLRLAALPPRVVVERVLETLRAGQELSGHMTVIEPDRARSRPLPTTTDTGTA